MALGDFVWQDNCITLQIEKTYNNNEFCGQALCTKYAEFHKKWYSFADSRLIQLKDLQEVQDSISRGRLIYRKPEVKQFVKQLIIWAVGKYLI